MVVGLMPRPPLSLRRKDAILDLPKRTSVVCGVEFGGLQTRPGHWVGPDEAGNRTFALRGAEFGSGRSAGGICSRGWVEVA